MRERERKSCNAVFAGSFDILGTKKKESHRVEHRFLSRSVVGATSVFSRVRVCNVVGASSRLNFLDYSGNIRDSLLYGFVDNTCCLEFNARCLGLCS